jgi:hypothetical protein
MTSLRTASPAGATQVNPTTRIRSEWVDRFLGSDPGLNRFRSAFMSVLTIAVILEAESLFVRFTHALQLPTSGAALSATQAAKVAMANHEYLVIMLLLGAIVGMVAAFGVHDPHAKGQLITMLFLPVPLIAALALGNRVGDQRILSLVLLAVSWAQAPFRRLCRAQ